MSARLNRGQPGSFISRKLTQTIEAPQFRFISRVGPIVFDEDVPPGTLFIAVNRQTQNRHAANATHVFTPSRIIVRVLLFGTAQLVSGRFSSNYLLDVCCFDLNTLVFPFVSSLF